MTVLITFLYLQMFLFVDLELFGNHLKSFKNLSDIESFIMHFIVDMYTIDGVTSSNVMKLSPTFVTLRIWYLVAMVTVLQVTCCSVSK